MIRAVGYAGVAVVACKTDKGIIRAISHPAYPTNLWHSTARQMINAVISQVGALHMEGTEWTGFYYQSMPYYLYDLPGAEIVLDVESGVWLFPWVRPPDDTKFGCALGISDHKNPIRLGDVPR